MVLQFPRFWAEGCRGDDAESTGLHIDTGRIENPRIRRIESLFTELQLRPFGDVEIFEERKVDVLYAVAHHRGRETSPLCGV